jgi:hypothetical protein
LIGPVFRCHHPETPAPQGTPRPHAVDLPMSNLASSHPGTRKLRPHDSSHHRVGWLAIEPPNLEQAAASIERILRDGRAADETMQHIRWLFKQESFEKNKQAFPK